METIGIMPDIFHPLSIVGIVHTTTRIMIHIIVPLGTQIHGPILIIVQDGRVHLVITGDLPGIMDGE